MPDKTLLEWVDAERHLCRDLNPNDRAQANLLHKFGLLLSSYVLNPEPGDQRESVAIQLAGLSLYIAETTPEENKEAE